MISDINTRSKLFTTVKTRSPAVFLSTISVPPLEQAGLCHLAANRVGDAYQDEVDNLVEQTNCC